MLKKRLKVLGIIGARSGSIGIKNKNIKKLNKKPLIFWSIKVALKSRFLNRVLVSTDSRQYQKISIQCGAEVPFLRPKKISLSESKEIDYIIHCLDWLNKNENYVPDIIVRMQPTSPFQLVDDIDRSIVELIKDKQATSTQVVSESEFHPSKALKVIEGTKYLKPYILGKNNNVVNRQILKKSYHRSNIITSKVKYLIKNKDHIGNKSIKIEIPKIRSLDINSKKDFLIAELINKVYKFLK